MEGGALIKLSLVEESPGVYRPPKTATYFDDATGVTFRASDAQLTRYNPPDVLINGEVPIYGTRTSTALQVYDPIFAAAQARQAAQQAAVGKPPAALSQLTKVALGALALGVPIAALAGILAAVGKGASAPTLTSDSSNPPPKKEPPPPSGSTPTPGSTPVPSTDRPRAPGKRPGGPSGSPLSPNNLAWYLQTGNLPQNYYKAPYELEKAMKKGGRSMKPPMSKKLRENLNRQLRDPDERPPRPVARPPRPVAPPRYIGSGDGRSARAEIVKKVMAEQGMKMIEASKYVKEHGLY
jgi:hypothetical protein